MASHPLACQHVPFQQALSPIDQHSPIGAHGQALAFKGEAGAPCPWAKEGLYFFQHWLLRGYGGGLAWYRRPSTPSPSLPILPSWPRAQTRQGGLTTKEKPCSMEVPSIQKWLPAGMFVTVRLMLAGPAVWVPKGSSSHSSSSTKSFQDTGLEHREVKVSQGSHRPGACPPHIIGSSEREGGLSPSMPSSRAGSIWQGRD